VFHISIWGAWSFVWGAKPTKAPRGDGTDHSMGFVRFCWRHGFLKWSPLANQANKWKKCQRLKTWKHVWKN